MAVPGNLGSEQPWLKTAGEAVGLIAGALALVYLLGGLMYALRLAFDGFSPEAIVGVIGQLPRESVITAGFLEGLGSALLVGVVAALGYGAVNGPRKRAEGMDDRLNTGTNWLLKLFGLALLSLALIAPAIWLAIATDGASWELVTSILGYLITFSLVCAGWFALRTLARRGWYRLGRAIAAGAIWTGMALAPSVMLAAAVVFESAQVCVEDEEEPTTGDLIAETKDRVLLATGTGNEKAVRSLPASRVRLVEYGDVAATTPCPDPEGDSEV